MAPEGPGREDWIVIHEQLSRLAKVRSPLDLEEGRWLLRAARAHVHRHLGFGSLVDYVERFLGYEPSTTEDKLRVAAALEQLPELTHSLQQGALPSFAARELTRVATAQTESAWIAAARDKTAQQLEELVAGRQPGDLPTSPARPELLRQVLEFEVSEETLALVREAMAKPRRDSGAPLDDDAALRLMAQRVLQAPAATAEPATRSASAAATSTAGRRSSRRAKRSRSVRR